MYKYEIFGLNVLSEIPLDCYVSVFEKPDVTICLDDNLGPFDIDNKYFVYNNSKIKFVIKNKIVVQIENGNSIKVNSLRNDNKILQLYILGTAMGTIMIQRSEFPLHGASVFKSGYGISVVGDSGAGKSSLAAGLAKNNWSVLTDDVIRIIYENEKPIINCSYPSMKIWDNTAEQLGINLSGSESVTDRDRKFYLRDDQVFKKTKTQLNYVFEISKAEVKEVTILELNKYESLNTLLRNTYRFNIVEFSNNVVEHFKFITRLSNDIRVFRITRPVEGFTVDDQIKLIERVVGIEYG